MCGEEEREDMEMEVDVDSFWIGSDSDEDFNEESGDVEDIKSYSYGANVHCTKFLQQR